MKTLGVMQPYLFPYLGYYQLVSAVDKFVFYDDVTFIKGGYINRNNILANGKVQRFTVAVPGSSSNLTYARVLHKISFFFLLISLIVLTFVIFSFEFVATRFFVLFGPF